jgi:excisionase family DNA binding protein
MYLRSDGPASKYVCRDCRAKIPQDALDQVFESCLASIEIEAADVVAAAESPSSQAELSRMLDGRPVSLADAWAGLDRPQRCQLVDLLVERVVVSRDAVSVELAEKRDSQGASAPISPNPLTSSHGSEGPRETKTSPRPDSDDDNLAKLLTVDEVASLLRTTSKSVYSMVERGVVPGVSRVGRRVLIQRDDLLRWLNESRASSPKERRA